MRICKRKFNNVNSHVKFTPLAVSNQNIGVLIVAIFSLEIKSTNKYIYIYYYHLKFYAKTYLSLKYHKAILSTCFWFNDVFSFTYFTNNSCK